MNWPQPCSWLQVHNAVVKYSYNNNELNIIILLTLNSLLNTSGRKLTTCDTPVSHSVDIPTGELQVLRSLEPQLPHAIPAPTRKHIDKVTNIIYTQYLNNPTYTTMYVYCTYTYIYIRTYIFINIQEPQTNSYPGN